MSQQNTATADLDDDDFYDEDDVDCWCDNPDIDLLEGRASCYQCGRRWWLTNEQLSREIELQAALIECIEVEQP